jgi:SAM-dependent methyltransferase
VPSVAVPNGYRTRFGDAEGVEGRAAAAHSPNAVRTVRRDRVSLWAVSPVVDYERHGQNYARFRQTDPRIAARIHAALGDARTVLNVGAGAGSYEPDDRWVLAVEPSATMRAQRPAGIAPAIDARAEALPFDDDAVDAAMACGTIHHWDPLEAGLTELRRVARGAVVVFTFELDSLPAWQQEHLAEGLTIERPRFPSMRRIAAALGGRVRVEHVPTPGDCVDGFFEAFWRRPEALLDPAVRASQSMWALLGPGVEQSIVRRLADALTSGAWDAEYGHLRQRDAFDGALRLVISEPA